MLRIMGILAFFLVLCTVASSLGHKYAKHQHFKPKKELSVSVNAQNDQNYYSLKISPVPALAADPSTFSYDEQWITVSYQNISFAESGTDWIGLFDGSIDNYLDTAPIEFGYVIIPANSSWSLSGTMKFKMINRRIDYVFVYCRTTTGGYRDVIAISNIVKNDKKQLPMRVHMALMPHNDSNTNLNEILITWIQLNVSKPELKYGTSKDSLDKTVNPIRIETYSRTNMCDIEYGQAAGTDGFFNPGNIISVILTDLKPNTQYYYKVGDEIYGWSNVTSFTSPPNIGDVNPKTNSLRMIAFGDMGTVALDFHNEHSFDYTDLGEIYSVNTSNVLRQSIWMEQTEYIVHFGDVSYAVGYLSEWDDFLYQIEPIARQIPWNVGIGNHEYGWTGEWSPPSNNSATDSYGPQDSGGECGVPTYAFFPYMSQNPWSSYQDRKPWFVLDYSITRVIMMSTEHDFSYGSEQWHWIKSTMQSTNRKETPWLILAGHRMMYSNSLLSIDVDFQTYMQQQLESLMIDYNVAMGWWGHNHVYVRTCAVYNNSCQTDGTAPVHLVIGMAGYELSSPYDNADPPLDSVEYFSAGFYGFNHFEYLNESHCLGRSINVNSTLGSVQDEFYVLNPYYYNNKQRN